MTSITKEFNQRLGIFLLIVAFKHNKSNRGITITNSKNSKDNRQTKRNDKLDKYLRESVHDSHWEDW